MSDKIFLKKISVIRKIDKVLVFFFLLFFFSSKIFGVCEIEKIIQRKNLSETYYSLRALDNKCQFSPEVFLLYGEAAYLAERFQEALWAASVGVSRSQEKDEWKEQLSLLKGRAYLSLGRWEEAILTLKPIVNKENTVSSLTRDAHLQWIKCYYLKGNKTIDSNVTYLLNLFKNRYKSSDQKELLDKWMENIQVK